MDNNQTRRQFIKKCSQATDAYCAGIMDLCDSTFSPSMIDPALERAKLRGLGTADLNNVDVIEISI